MNKLAVAPRAGAWIEIFAIIYILMRQLESHPVRVRGLKSYQKGSTPPMEYSRTPCGCVD